MQIKSSKGSITRLTKPYRLLPSGGAGYLYEREMLEGTLLVLLRLAGHYEGVCPERADSNDHILIELSCSYMEGGMSMRDTWRRFYISSELMPESSQSTIDLEILGMDLEEAERTKLEDLQSIIDELDKIEDSSGAPEEIQVVAEDNGLVLVEY